MTMWTAGTIFAEFFDCPLILFSPNSPVISKWTTNVINFSVQPFITAPFIEPMTFLQRLSNHAMFLAARQAMSLLSSLFHSHQSSYLEVELGLTVQPPDKVLRERVAVMLTCSHPLTHGAWQYLPNIIEVGGLQLRPPRKLPEHLQNFMDKVWSWEGKKKKYFKIRRFGDIIKETLSNCVKGDRRRHAGVLRLLPEVFPHATREDADVLGGLQATGHRRGVEMGGRHQGLAGEHFGQLLAATTGPSGASQPQSEH